jgi:hypothetical protein
VGEWLYEYDTGHPYGPASEQDVEFWKKAQQSGKDYFGKGHHGYELKVYVAKKRCGS